MKKLILFACLCASALSVCAQAASASFVVGDNFTLSVTASGTNTVADPFKYQWKKDGNVWVGMTSDHVDFNNTQLFDAGSYTVDVTNSAGKTTAPAFVVTIAPKVVSVPPSAAAISATKR